MGAVVKHHKSQVIIVQKTVRLINYIIDDLPLCYRTRSGCVVKEHMLEEHSQRDTSRIMGVLLVTEFNELVVNLCSGSHRSALRTVRSLLEWLVKAVAAVSDRRIFTKKSKDANKAVCFQGLSLAIRWEHARKKLTKEEKRQYRELIRTPQVTKYENVHCFVDFLSSATIPNGLGTIPKKLNYKIMSNIKQQNLTQEGPSLLYFIYDQLSKTTHNNLPKLDDIPYGGMTDFHDPEYFNESYSVIYNAMDIILCFYYVLVDIDVFHRSEDRKLYREHVKKEFNDIFAAGEFGICRTLFGSQIWNDPSLEFTHPREG